MRLFTQRERADTTLRLLMLVYGWAKTAVQSLTSRLCETFWKPPQAPKSSCRRKCKTRIRNCPPYTNFRTLMLRYKDLGMQNFGRSTRELGTAKDCINAHLCSHHGGTNAYRFDVKANQTAKWFALNIFKKIERNCCECMRRLNEFFHTYAKRLQISSKIFYISR